MGRIISALCVAAMAAGLAAPAAQAQEAAPRDCGTVISATCAERLGAGALAPTDVSCQAQWTAYRLCIKELATSAAPDAGAGPVAGGCSESRAQSLWADTKAANDCLGYAGFREACPDTPEARLAQVAMRRLSCGAAPAAPIAAPTPQPTPRPTPRPTPKVGPAPGFQLAIRKKKDIRRFSDLGASTICLVDNSKGARVIWRHFKDKGQQIYVYHFITQQDALAAYDQDRCDAIALWTGDAEAQLARLSSPDEHLLMPEIIPVP